MIATPLLMLLMHMPKWQVPSRAQAIHDEVVLKSHRYSPSTIKDPSDVLLDGRKVEAIAAAYKALLRDPKMNKERAPLGNYWIYLHRDMESHAGSNRLLVVEFKVRKFYSDPKFYILDGADFKYALRRIFYVDRSGRVIRKITPRY